MIQERFLIHELIVDNATTTTNEFNEVVEDWDNPVSTPMDSWLQQNMRDEERSSGRNADEQLWLLMSNTDGLVTANSRIRWPARGLTFEVEGEPEPTYSPAGFHHLEATLRIQEG